MRRPEQCDSFCSKGSLAPGKTASTRQLLGNHEWRLGVKRCSGQEEKGKQSFKQKQIKKHVRHNEYLT